MSTERRKFNEQEWITCPKCGDKKMAGALDIRYITNGADDEFLIVRCLRCGYTIEKFAPITKD